MTNHVDNKHLGQQRTRKVGQKLLTRYWRISGKAFSMSMVPTIATVNVEGSLKQSSKYWQALMGSTLLRSLALIGCTNNIKVTQPYSNFHKSTYPLINAQSVQGTVCKTYYKWIRKDKLLIHWGSSNDLEVVGVAIVQFPNPICICCKWITFLSLDTFECHLHHKFHFLISRFHFCYKKLVHKLHIPHKMMRNTIRWSEMLQPSAHEKTRLQSKE